MTATYRALDFHFELSVDDPALRGYLTEVLAALAAPTDADAGAELERFRVTDAEPDGSSARFDLVLGDAELERRRPAAVIVDGLVQRMNSRCVESSGWLSSHACAVAREDQAIVFPADSESGKSTLAAGLVRAGFEYVSDEAVAFEWSTGCIEPYPKPLSLDRGSWPLFPELDPSGRFDPGVELTQWQVPPAAIGPGRVSRPCRARWLVFPKYTAGAATGRVPISRGEALVEWSKNTFRFNEQGRDALALLGRLVGEVDCYRMTVGDLEHAVASVRELVAS